MLCSKMASPDPQLSWNQQRPPQKVQQEVQNTVSAYQAYQEIMEVCRPFYALENSSSSMPFYQNEILPRLEDSIALLQSQRRLSQTKSAEVRRRVVCYYYINQTSYRHPQILTCPLFSFLFATAD
jgi:hypothetical protein